MTCKQNKLILYGDSSYAEMIAHYFNTDSSYEVVAFCVDRDYQTRRSIGSLPVIPLEEIETQYAPEDHHIFAAIGYKRVRTHKALYQKITTLNYPVASYISTQAIVDSSADIGQNCLILPGAIIEPEVHIEENCFINSGAILCHHARLGAHCIIAAGSLVGGYTTIGPCSLIGFRATVAELLKVEEETLVGAMSLLLCDTQKHTMYTGIPAEPRRTHSDTGIELLTPAEKGR
jgi:UDP-N-acetylbacillosamine N-acetyltransferase